MKVHLQIDSRRIDSLVRRAFASLLLVLHLSGIALAEQSPYQILGVSPDATPEEIKSAYRRLSSIHHPDRNPGDPEAARLQQRINDAYASLRTAQSAAPVEVAHGSGGAKTPRPSEKPSGYETAFDFAKKPIRDGGFGLYGAEADTWARETVRRMKPASVARWIKVYERAIAHASQSVEEGGQGLGPRDAKKWAARMSNTMELPELGTWIRRYGAAIERALKSAQDGFVVVPPQELSAWASRFADGRDAPDSLARWIAARRAAAERVQASCKAGFSGLNPEPTGR